MVVDYCVRGFGPAWQRIVQIFVGGVGIATMGVLLWVAPYRLASQAGIIEIVGLPRYALSVPFFASCLLICLNCLVEVVTVVTSGALPPRQPRETLLNT